MYASSNIACYATITAEINRRYCQRQGYGFCFEQYDEFELTPPHEKVRIMQRHLASAEYLLWIDADACVVNFSQRLEEFCSNGNDIVIAGHQFGFAPFGERMRYEIGGVPCGLNSGVMMFRNSKWSSNFLADWWDRCVEGERQGTAFMEQGQLQQMLMENANDIQRHINIVTPCSRLNRCDDDGQDVCEFILHLWGSDEETRTRIFQQIAAGQHPETSISLPTFDVNMHSS
tara:strand:+ start:99 stop:791 length:693 start_codon:yes stop_codon:yes gene_type:complete